MIKLRHKKRPVIPILNLFILGITIITLLAGCGSGGGGGSEPKSEPIQENPPPVVEKTEGLISGRVINFLTGNPVPGAVISIEGQVFSDYTDQDGIFLLKDLPSDKEYIVTIQANGFATNQKIVNVPSKTSVPIDVKLKPVTWREKISLTKGVNVAKPLRENRVEVTTPDRTLRVSLSKEALQRTLYKSLSLETMPDEVFLELTTGDPITEKDIFPGDFRAIDHKATTAQKVLYQDASDTPNVTLESVVFSEITLRDGAGNEIVLPSGTSVDVRMKIPDNLQDVYRKLYESGDRLVPWYSYDESIGAWVREGEARLLMVDEDGDGAGETIYAEGVASHFTWWNVDFPISSHACIQGKVINDDGNPVSGSTVIAEGVDYQGRSYPQVTGANGNYTVRVKRDSTVRIWAELGSYKSSQYSIKVPDVGLPPELGGGPGGSCIIHNISNITYQITGRVINQNSATLSGVTVIANTGISTATGNDGRFSLESPPDQGVNLTFRYTANNLTYTITKSVSVGGADIDIGNVLIDTSTINAAGRALLEKIDGTIVPLTGATVSADNGQKGITNSNGEYLLLAAKPTAESPALIISFSYYLSGIGLLSSNLTCPLNLTDTRCPDMTFKEEAALISGAVTDGSGRPLKGVFISTEGNSTNTDEAGRYSIKVPANSTVIVTALYMDGCYIENPGKTIVTGAAGSDNQSDFVMGTPAGITGQVTAGGESREGVKVYTSVDWSKGGTARILGCSTVSDSSGNYQLKALPDRDYNVQFVPENCPKKELLIRSGPTGTDVELNPELESCETRPQIREMVVTPAIVDLSCDDHVLFEANVYDPDTSGISYSISATGGSLTGQSSGTVSNANSPGGAELSSMWVAPSQSGDYDLTLEVDDGAGGNATAIRRVQVRDKINKDPVILDLKILNNNAWVMAYDPDGGALEYSWDIPAGWGSSITNVIQLTIPTGTSEGDYPVKVTVRDMCGAVATGTAYIRVEGQVIENQPPVIHSVSINPIAPVKVEEQVILTVNASDPEGDTISYEWRQGTTLLSENSSFEWTAPIVTDKITYTFTIKVIDSKGASATKDIYIEVVPNKPPAVTLYADSISVLLGEVVNLTAAAADPEEDPLSYTWNATGGTISGTGTQVIWQSPGVPGNYTVSIEVSDGVNLVKRSVIINVSEPGNNPPVVGLSADRTEVNPGEIVNLTATASDPDGDILLYNWIVTGESIAANGATAIWTAPGTCGVYTVTVSVSDGRGGESTDSSEIGVVGCPGATISGYVRDGLGIPVVAALVELYDKYDRLRFDVQTVTGSDGYYEFVDVPSGTYYVVIARDGFKIESREIIVP